MGAYLHLAFGRLAFAWKTPEPSRLDMAVATLHLDVSEIEPTDRFHHLGPQVRERHVCQHKTVAGHRQVPLHADPHIAMQWDAVRPTHMQWAGELHRGLWHQRIDERAIQVTLELYRDLGLGPERQGSLIKRQAHLRRLDGAASKSQLGEGQGESRRTAEHRPRDTEFTLADFGRIQTEIWKLHDA